jgi:hypothetical protein
MHELVSQWYSSQMHPKAKLLQGHERRVGKRGGLPIALTSVVAWWRWRAATRGGRPVWGSRNVSCMPIHVVIAALIPGWRHRIGVVIATGRIVVNWPAPTRRTARWWTSIAVTIVIPIIRIRIARRRRATAVVIFVVTRSTTIVATTSIVVVSTTRRTTSGATLIATARRAGSVAISRSLGLLL